MRSFEQLVYEWPRVIGVVQRPLGGCKGSCTLVSTSSGRRPTLPHSRAHLDSGFRLDGNEDVRVRPNDPIVEVRHLWGLEADDERVRDRPWVHRLHSTLAMVVVDIKARLRERTRTQSQLVAETWLPLVPVLAKD